MIPEHEMIFLGGLIKFPEMVDDFFNIEPYKINNKIHKALVYFKEIGLEALEEGGAWKALMNLKRRKLFTEPEYDALFELSTDSTLFPNAVEASYDIIEEEAQKRTLTEQINRLDIENLTLEELKEKLFFLQEKIEVRSDETYQTFKDLLPECNKPQLSLIQFKHSWLQSRVAIDSNYFVIVAARTGSGKTTFLSKLAMENSATDRVLIFTCELTKLQLTRKVTEYGDYYHHDNVFMIYRTKLRLSEVRKHVTKIKPRFIIIDQFNKIHGEGKTAWDRATNVAENLKLLAGNLNIPIICLAQINRSGEEGKRPMIHHLKNSGSLEEEADVVMILNIEIDDFDKSSKTVVYVDKNRSLNGTLGHAEFNFDQKTNLYTERG